MEPLLCRPWYNSPLWWSDTEMLQMRTLSTAVIVAKVEVNLWIFENEYINTCVGKAALGVECWFDSVCCLLLTPLQSERAAAATYSWAVVVVHTYGLISSISPQDLAAQVQRRRTLHVQSAAAVGQHRVTDTCTVKQSDRKWNEMWACWVQLPVRLLKNMTLGQIWFIFIYIKNKKNYGIRNWLNLYFGSLFDRKNFWVLFQQYDVNLFSA